MKRPLKKTNWDEFMLENERSRRDFLMSAAEEAFEKQHDLERELKEYKNIEGELGISIVTLYKALRYGVFRLRETELPLYTKGTLRLNCDYGNWDPQIITEDGYALRLGDYGDTWALTPEDFK